MARIIERIKNRLHKHTPLVEVSISRENLLHNLHSYQQRFPHVSFAPVLKSNAYGHDLGTVARILDGENISFFMVDSAFEARRLRIAGIRSRIVVMGYVRPEEIAKNEIANTDYAIVDDEQLKVLARIAKKPVRLHLKIDTGMHRHGLPPEIIPAAIAGIKKYPKLSIVGVCSHFADADNEDDQFTQKQLTRWKEAVAQVLAAFPTIEYKHLAATKGVRFAADAASNVVRLGIGLYGIDTAVKKDADVRPVLAMNSIISSVRTLHAGESVGYNATHTTEKSITIATVPVGYFEGVDRRLSNKGYFMVAGHACPIVGRVSMNMTSIDVSAVPSVEPGQKVLVISRMPEDPNSVSAIAEMVSTSEYRETPYVILTHVASSLRRVVE